MSQIRKGAILSYISILLTNIIGLFITPFIVRSLGESEYGLYTLIGAFVGYLSIMDLGLNNTIVRYVSKYRAENDADGESKFLGSIMLVYFLISFLVMIIGIGLYFNLDNFFGDTLSIKEMEKARIMMIILIINLMVNLPGGAFTAICNAYEYFVFPRALRIIKYTIRSVLVVVILKYGAKSIGLVLLDTLMNISVIILTFIYVKRNLKTSFNFRQVEKNLFKEIFSYSIWIFLFAIISQIQWKGGQFIIGSTLNTTQVGIYAIGIVLGGYYGAFSGAISNLFLPRATQMIVQQSSSEDLTQMMIRIARFSLFSLIIIFIGFLFLGKEFIYLWVGESYKDAYYIAIIVMIGYTIPLLQTFANSLLEARKLFKFKALVYLTCLLLGTGLSFFFVRNYGIKIVINFIVGFWLLGQLIMNIFYNRKLKLNIFSFFINIQKGLWLVFLLMIIISYNISKISFFSGWINFILKSIIIFLVYLPLLYFIGMNSSEKEYIKNILKIRSHVSN